MNPFRKTSPLCAGTRREFLWQAGAGFAGVALSALLAKDGFFARSALASELLPGSAGRRPARRTQVKSCIFLFMYGGPSQMDLFDYKPELQKHDGKSVNLELRRKVARHSSRQQTHLGSPRSIWPLVFGCSAPFKPPHG